MSSHPLPTTFEDALRMATAILRSSSFMAARYSEERGIESESEQLVVGAYRQASGRGRTFGRDDLYVRVMEAFPREAGERLVIMANRRAAGEPLQYLLGYQYFLNHEYEVDSNVLIPRPETEILVYEVMQTFKRRIDQPTFGIEIGVGSGCIAIELLKSFPGLRMVGTELNEGAIAVATRNAAKILGPDHERRFQIVRTESRDHIYEPLPSADIRADFIVSNPPYLIEGSNEVDSDVRTHEPPSALFAPAGDPLYFYRRIAEGAEAYLRPHGSLFLEGPHERIDAIAQLFGADWKKSQLQDLTGRPRVLQAEWKGISVLN